MKVFIIVQIMFVLIDCIIAALLTILNVSNKKTEIIGLIAAGIMVFINGVLVGYYDLSGVFYTIATVVTGLFSVFFGNITSIIIGNLKGD